MSIIDLKAGDKIKYTNPEAGYKMDSDLGKEYLTLNTEYTINTIEINSCQTSITLKEIDKVIEFNSVLFSIA